MNLVFDVFPLVGVGKFLLLFNDRLPQLGQFCIQGYELPLALGQVVFSVYSLYRAFSNAKRAIYTFIRIDHQKVRPSAKTIDRANIHTICIPAPYASFGYYISHDETPFIDNAAF